jgi:hypothetical protein
LRQWEIGGSKLSLADVDRRLELAIDRTHILGNSEIHIFGRKRASDEAERLRGQMKPEAVWEIEFGARLTAAEISDAMVQHGVIMERMRRFQEKYELMLCAVNQVPIARGSKHPLVCEWCSGSSGGSQTEQ